MTIEETAELIKVKLNENTKNSSDLLYDVKISTDPYEPITDEDLPLVLIETDKTEFENAEQGHVVRQNHLLTATCLVLAQDIEHQEYKKEVNQLVKKTITKLMTIVDNNIHKIIPQDLSHSELTIGSLKVSGIIIGIKVSTYWEDF